MKKEFAPYLEHLIPSLFSMATLNPEMGIQGQETTGDIEAMLQEVKPATATDAKEKHFNITTDEIEEKDVALQMLAVFIDELGGSFAQYIEQTSTILLKLTQYKANDSIRNSVASSFPGLVKCAKEAG